MPTVPDIHRRGTRADQATLAAPPLTVGTLYFVTDEGVTERWNGATWDAYSGAGGGSVRVGAIGITIDGGGSVITTGVKGFLEVPVACTITAVTLLSTDAAVTAGSIVVDLWKDSYANYPPVVGDSITASAKPTLSAATKSRDTTLTGWTTALAAGDILGVTVDSVATLTKVWLSLTVEAT
jgi:hypothetical protein